MINYEKKIEKIRLKIRKKYMTKTSKKRKGKINSFDFTIISNNCWGGFIYQSYALQYSSPTIGLFIMATDYIKFVKEFEKYINFELLEINNNDSKWYELLKNNQSFGKYPIGKIGDIEIHFLHYKSFSEAKEKWNRRKNRINYNRIIFKFSDMNGCSRKNIQDFQKIKRKNKICFITNKDRDIQNEYTFVVRKKDKLLASYEPFGKSKYIDINKFINQME